MKKLIFSALSIALLTGAMTSCGKSSKGKLSNDWKIESYTENSTNTYTNGDKEVSSESFSGSTVTMTTTETSSGVTEPSETYTYTLNDPTFKINKDGTWERNATKIIKNTTILSTTTSTINEKSSGSWSFVNKNKEEEFKKNERVLFNTLATSSNTTAVTVYETPNNPSITTTSSNSSTYKVGEMPMVYTITESKGKALELSYEGSNSNSNTSGNTSTSSSYVNSGKMNLVQ